VRERAQLDAAEHERGLITSFFFPARQERYLALLGKPKRRGDITREFAHFKHLDPRRIVSISPSAQHFENIYELLRRKGAPEVCYGFSEWDEIDGKTLPLRDALKMVVGSGMGTFLSCLPGRLGYFEGEVMKTRYILELAKGK